MIIVTTFLTKYEYPFWKYNHKPKPNFGLFQKWYSSITTLRINALVLHDELPEEFTNRHTSKYINFKKINNPSLLNPVDERWGIYYDYLTKECTEEVVFFTDFTDVMVLNQPKPERNIIYIGNEEIKVASGWMNQRFALFKDQEKIAAFKAQHGNKKLLNCGIFGGYKELLRNPIREIADVLNQNEVSKDTIDMCAANIVLYSNYEHKIFYGEPLNTEFWKEDVGNKICWFKHK